MIFVLFFRGSSHGRFQLPHARAVTEITEFDRLNKIMVRARKIELIKSSSRVPVKFELCLKCPEHLKNSAFGARTFQNNKYSRDD